VAKKPKAKGRALFIDPTGQLRLLDKSFEQEVREGQGVECLGMTFANEEERRKFFVDRLREKLADPEFRKTSGFPNGNDEDILRLSDPPYFTACPNPFIADFVQVYGKPKDLPEEYRREPFAVDVSEGKTDQLYKAHGYHTKVPHVAIVPSILHYTKPGDIVLDAFCGSGMTGLAAQWCGTAPQTYRRTIEDRWVSEGLGKPEWGTRRVVLGDLSPAATFIASNYNIPFYVPAFVDAARRILDEVQDELGWMYETLHTDGKSKGRINFTVWSEVFSCPECSGEINFFAEALDEATKRVHDEFPCPTCGAELTKKKLDRLFQSRFDAALRESVKVPKRVPVLVNYTVGEARFEKTPDVADLEVIRRIAELTLPPEIPTNRMMNASTDVEVWGDEWRAGVASFSHVHHLFLPRPAHALASMWRRACAEPDLRLRNIVLFFIEQAIWGMSVLARYAPTHFSQVNQYMSGRLRVFAQHAECSPWYILDGKLSRMNGAFTPMPSTHGAAAVTTGDCGRIPIEDESIDYVFTDPPFGHNFAYAELNFIVEAWHRVITSTKSEAIVSPHQQKGTSDYQELMRRCFVEYHRVLKPGRWMTVVFSNSSNAIWRAIQEAMGTAGFVVADVRTLDKQQGSFNQVHGVSVDQDLVISAYKPTAALTEQFRLGSTTPESTWAFIVEHLRHVPVFVGRDGQVDVVLERTAQMLHDRMVAFHVQRSLSIPLSTSEFLSGIMQRYPERDGMYFLSDQVAEYDRKRTSTSVLKQQSLFITDEASAIQWVRQQLAHKPQSFQDLQPMFMRELQAWAKHERTIELRDILEQNFLRYDGREAVPSQIHAYLSSNFKDLRKLAKDDPLLVERGRDCWYVPDPAKQADLERLRERSLLKEFTEYAGLTQRQLKQFRIEAIRAGFKAAYEAGEYRKIVAVAKKLPEAVLQEDDKLLMYYDVACMRLGEE
jgi:16S rRNA G966 N2-methylase RsmD